MSLDDRVGLGENGFGRTTKRVETARTSSYGVQVEREISSSRVVLCCMDTHERAWVSQTVRR